MSFQLLGRAALCASFVVLSSSVTVAAASTEEGLHASARTVASGKTASDARVRGFVSGTPLMLDGKTLAYAPGEHGANALTVVYLHGVHGKAENGCPYLRAGASEVGWLVCPKGIEPGPAGTASWGMDVPLQAAAVDEALHAAVAHGASSAPGVAVGFSQGGYVALDLVKSHRGHFCGLVLLAAPEAHPSAEKLHAAGVERVVLGAGQRDSARFELMKDAKRLASEGMDVKFIDLGDVGHTYAAEHPEVLSDAIAWAAGA